MNGIRDSDKSFERCLVEAAAWRRELTEAGVESTPVFEAWLAADARHRAAWRQMQTMWDFAGRVEASPEVLELRRVALTNARNAARRRGRRAWFAVSVSAAKARLHYVAAAAIAGIAVASVLVWQWDGADVYRTQPGERRLVTLSDGSRVQLDSSTELRVRYSEDRRELTLVKGQTRFDVAHDVSRPFSVLANGRKVVATGTAFNVDVLDSKLMVTLIEGRVVILPENATVLSQVLPRSEHQAEGAVSVSEKDVPTAQKRVKVLHQNGAEGGIELKAGELLVVDANGSENVGPANIERATAWESGQMILEGEPLQAVVARINRYSRQTVVITDPRVDQLRISGVFNTDDVPRLIETLESYLPVDARNRNDTIELSYR